MGATCPAPGETVSQADQILQALDPEQRQVATALRGPVRVLAGAGTGKTRAITHRIAYGVATGVYAPSEVLAVTFTTRAAGEMRTRLRNLGVPGVQARTFHSAALRQLRYFWPKVHGVDPPELIDSKLPLIGGAARRQRLSADASLMRDLAAEVEWAKVSNVTPQTYARIAGARGRSVTGADAALVGRIFESYEDLKRGRGLMDLEDVLLLTAGLMAEDPRVAASIRAQYKWFVVDEFQDVSPLQSALLELWLGEREELCVVGDPAQTIYSFAGADAGYLRDFATRRPSAQTIELVRNYRSTPQIVAAANGLLAGTRSIGVQLQAQAQSGPEVAFEAFPDEVAEAEGVARRISALIELGIPAGQIAVLFRINAQSEAFEEALSARQVPYVVRGAARFFERPEVRQAITLLRGAVRAGEGGALGGGALGGGALGGGAHGGDEPGVETADGVGGGPTKVHEQVGALLATLGWAPQPPTGRGQARDRWESWQALVDQAESAPSLDWFVEDLERRAADQHSPVADGVTLATFHAAKGLEWQAVFCAGVHDGAVPITYAQGPAEIEEERRLLYVGITRARERLILTWAAARASGGRQSRSPSRFLTPLLPGELRRTQEAAAPGRKRNRGAATCRQCGSALTTAAEKKLGRCASCPASYDEELFEALRSWRGARAGADKVPAYVVCTDATLQLIAEHRPKNAQALLKINGIGAAKLDKYGEEILAVIAAG